MAILIDKDGKAWEVGDKRNPQTGEAYLGIRNGRPDVVIASVDYTDSVYSILTRCADLDPTWKLGEAARAAMQENGVELADGVFEYFSGESIEGRPIISAYVRPITPALPTPVEMLEEARPFIEWWAKRGSLPVGRKRSEKLLHNIDTVLAAADATEAE